MTLFLVITANFGSGRLTLPRHSEWASTLIWTAAQVLAAQQALNNHLIKPPINAIMWLTGTGFQEKPVPDVKPAVLINDMLIQIQCTA